MCWALKQIISGGQTGADRAALDWAILHDVPHGGWCPRGRRAEDGPIALCYRLRETPLADYYQRTEWNVRDSDGTVVFSLNQELGGGSLLTLLFAQAWRKPCLHLWPGVSDPPRKLQEFVAGNKIRVLNVAGPRASREPGISHFVRSILERTFPPDLLQRATSS
jgi:hypothetical protein